MGFQLMSWVSLLPHNSHRYDMQNTFLCWTATIVSNISEGQTEYQVQGTVFRLE